MATLKALVGSENGCIITCDRAFSYGFGATAPTEFSEHYDFSQPFEYGGAYGKMWVWDNKADISYSITYWPAV